MQKIVVFIFIIAGMILPLLEGCGHSTIIKRHEVADIPDIPFTRITKLYNPEGTPDKTLAGLVFIMGEAKICTDYPREENIKNLEELDMVEKQTYKYFNNYVIKAGDQIFGYVAVPIDYRMNIWENLKDEKCRYKVQIIEPEKIKGNNGIGTGFGPGPGGF